MADLQRWQSGLPARVNRQLSRMEVETLARTQASRFRTVEATTRLFHRELVADATLSGLDRLGRKAGRIVTGSPWLEEDVRKVLGIYSHAAALDLLEF